MVDTEEILENEELEGDESEGDENDVGVDGDVEDELPDEENSEEAI